MFLRSFGLGQQPVTDWFSSGCGGPRVRLLDNWQLEIEGGGTPSKNVNDRVNQYEALVRKWANQYGLTASLIAGIIQVESQGRADVVSNDRGFGLMQLTSAAARKGRSDTELLDPDTNIELGTIYFSEQMDRYKGNILRALAAYNAGSAICGSSCAWHDDDRQTGSAPCVQKCEPTQWNLLTNCPPAPDGSAPGTPRYTFDYVGTVLGFNNGAALGSFGKTGPVVATGEGGPTGSAGIGALGLAAVLGLFGLAYAFLPSTKG
jgi:hypothetical protein